jgi:hypothetical protein
MLLNQGFLLVKLKSSLFYGRHHDLVDRYGISVSQMTTGKLISLNGTDFNMEDESCGVPQGSILDHYRFLYYANDMSKSLSKDWKLPMYNCAYSL